MALVQVAFADTSQCLAQFSRIADSMKRLQDEQRLTEGCQAIEGILPASKPFLRAACPADEELVGNRIISLLFDIVHHHRTRYPCQSALLLKCSLTFSVNESIALNEECVRKAASLVYSFDWSHSTGDDILDCFLLLPLLGVERNDEEAVAHKYKKMQAEVIGTLVQRLRQIYKSNRVEDECDFLARFALFPQLPLTVDYSSSQLRLCRQLFSFLPKLLLDWRTRFILELLYEPWANLLTSLVESLRRKFGQDASLVEFRPLEVGAWRALTVLTPLSSAAPSLRALLNSRIPLVAVEALQVESDSRRLGDVIKFEVYEWFTTYLSSDCEGADTHTPYASALLQCCLKELLLLKASDEVEIVNERGKKKRKKEKISERQVSEVQRVEFGDNEAMDVTTICLVALKTLRAIFEKVGKGLDRSDHQAAVATLVEVARALIEKLSSSDDFYWSECLKATCETLGSVFFHLNNVIVPVTLILSVLKEAKRSLKLSDANELDVLIRDINCMVSVSCGPNVRSAHTSLN